MKSEILAQLPDAERQMVADLETRGITVRVEKLAENSFSCRARYSDDHDDEVTYFDTPEKAVRQTYDNVRATRPHLFE